MNICLIKEIYWIVFLLIIPTLAYKENRALLQALNSGLCNIQSNDIFKQALVDSNIEKYFTVPTFECSINYPTVAIGSLKNVIDVGKLKLCDMEGFSKYTRPYRDLIAGNLTSMIGSNYKTKIEYEWIDIYLSGPAGYFNSLLNNIAKCDVVFSSTSVTSSRSVKVDFTYPFLDDTNGIIRSKRSPSLGPLNTTQQLLEIDGIKVATIPGSIYSDWVSSNMIHPDLITSIDVKTALTLIDNEIVDIFLWDYGSLVHFFDNTNNTFELSFDKINLIPNVKSMFVELSFPTIGIIAITLGIFGVLVLLFSIGLILLLVLLIRSKRKRSISQKIYELKPSVTKLHELHNKMKSEDWLVETSVIKIQQKIGSGSFGNVFKGKLRSRTPVAIKVSKSEIGDEHLEEFVNEAKLCSSLKHPNIVQFLGICIDDGTISLIYELMDNGSLTDVIRQGKLDLNLKLKILQQVASAMADLHERDPPILHRDLKSDNILLDSNMVAKVGDFGLSKMTYGINVGTIVGTPYYMAPEIIRGEPYGKPADVYSFSIIMWQMLMNKSNPYTEDVFKIQYNVSRGIRPSLDGIEETPYVRLMKRCWSDEPYHRPTFDEVYRMLIEMA